MAFLLAVAFVVQSNIFREHIYNKKKYFLIAHCLLMVSDSQCAIYMYNNIFKRVFLFSKGCKVLSDFLVANKPNITFQTISNVSFNFRL